MAAPRYGRDALEAARMALEAHAEQARLDVADQARVVFTALNIDPRAATAAVDEWAGVDRDGSDALERRHRASATLRGLAIGAYLVAGMPPLGQRVRRPGEPLCPVSVRENGHHPAHGK